MSLSTLLFGRLTTQSLDGEKHAIHAFKKTKSDAGLQRSKHLRLKEKT